MSRLARSFVPTGLLLGLATILMTAGCSGRSKAAATDETAQSNSTAAQDAKKPDKKKKYTNKLAGETSLYLLMHAHNPVNWYPWGPEAFAKAKKENKVIFLSVGYSSCHWCHVMERESFMDEEIAGLLNKHFVCIKVDREERPDVDKIYMTAVQLYPGGGNGGWPMSVFMTPEAKPFVARTYFPARDGDRGPQSMGFLTVIKKVQEFWKDKPEAIKTDANTLANLVKEQLEARQPKTLSPPGGELLGAVEVALEQRYDPSYGGFGYLEANPRRPKFPEPSNLIFLAHQIRAARLAKKDDKAALDMFVGTLERMAMGGIRDHLGGGFHRYSVDRFWRIPHFEKMLYDNGQLASAYAEGYALTKRADFRQVVEELLAFVLREMTDENGGFYSAMDAESEHEEGKFYRWDKSEIEKALSKEEFKLFAAAYGLDQEPNFEEKYYAPQFNEPLAKISKKLKLKPSELEARLKPIREKLFAIRAKRERPLTDKKILSGWNGLMIRGFADSGRLLSNEDYIQAAEKAADFVLKNMRGKDGRLLRTYGKGQAKLNAYLDDYAFMIDGLIGLHQATAKQRWLDEAVGLMELQLKHYWDTKQGGFFFTSTDHESLLARSKDPVDGALPAGNSVSAQNLVYLAAAAKKTAYLDQADETISNVSGIMQRAPQVAPRMAVAVGELIKIRPRPKKPEEKKPEEKKPEEKKPEEKKPEEKKPEEKKPEEKKPEEKKPEEKKPEEKKPEEKKPEEKKPEEKKPEEKKPEEKKPEEKKPANK